MNKVLHNGFVLLLLPDKNTERMATDMLKRVLVSMLCLITLCAFTLTCLAEEAMELTDVADAADVTAFTNVTEKSAVPQDHIQYFVKWDESRSPEDSSMTEEEYLAILEKDKNENGILDILEEDDEEDVTAASIATGILGDLNGDELVDNRDVILLYRHIAGWSQDINSDILDFNGDGYINSSDANHLLKYVSGWPDVVLYKGKKNDIIYHLYSEGMYVPETGIDNSNPDYYYSSEGLSLKNIQADGYIFEGWYDGEGQSATRIRKIDAGETGEIELYARWTPRSYKIDFDSSLVPVESKYYTIETGTTLTNPSLANYIFVGWTVQEDGRLVNGIPKGTFGNLVLVANWASRRNIAKPVQRLGAPVIAEDSTNGKIFFLYKLGDIENVPLFTLLRFSSAEGIATSVTMTEQTSISTSDARTIGQTVAKATTDSATWTLSEGWNESTSVSQETLEQQGLTREEAETIAKTTSNTYRMDTTESYSDVITDSSQYAYKGSIGTGSSVGQTQTTSENFKYSVDASVGLEASMEAEVKAPGVGSVKSGMKATESISVGEEYGGSVTNSGTTTNSWNRTLEEAGQASTARTSTKNWNASSGYSNSNSLSNSRTTSQQISEIVANKWGYGNSYSKNGEQSSGQAFTTENSQQDNYSNTVTYNSSTLCSKVTEYKTDGRIDGYYRLVLASTAHVFGVVGYDVATCSYFAYTFTVMDDKTFEFLDYSKNSSNFNDNEISVIPFVIPSFVNDYVNSRIARTGGLQISMAGVVTDYTGDDPLVLVPSYWDVDNGDGTYTSVKVTGISPNAFRNNTNVEGIMLSEYISDIPDSAFEGCTSLRDVNIPGLTHIGNRAFYGCTSLSTMTIPEDVVPLGTNAFYDVDEVKITAANSDVALAAVNSGAKSLVLNIASISEDMEDVVLEAPSSMDVLEIQGGRKQFENLKVKSYAGITKINGINFVDCMQVPLELHSDTVNLNQTSVSGSGYCMIIAKDNCAINLFGTNQMTSSNGNAIVCGNVTLANSDSNVQAQLQVSGNVYVCGAIGNQSRYLTVTNGEIIYISQEEYEKYISGVFQVQFDANGGTVQETERVAYSGASIGALPTPTRTGYTFAGWYTAASGGTEVTASTAFTSSSPITIYAHWTANQYTVSFYENGGTSSNPTSKTVTYDSTYGTLATATWDCHTFDGWYTAASGGTKITSSTKVTITSSQTLYAHWTLNPELGWVTENNVPEGAQITQTSWSYRESQESTSSTLAGYTSNGSYWKQTGSGSSNYAGFPGGFDTGHWIYTSFMKSAYSCYENTTTKRTVSNSWAGYVYWHWMYDSGTGNGTSGRAIYNQYGYGPDNGFLYKYFDAFTSTNGGYSSDAYYCNSMGLTNYIIPERTAYADCHGATRWFRFDYYTSSYTDYQKIFKYYRDVSYSTTDPGNGSNISSKVKYVKYREK